MEVVYCILANGTRREVPLPGQKQGLIERAHILSGHFGAQRTLHLLHGRYWWPGLQRDVLAHVARCTQCDRVRASFKEPQA